MKNSFIKVFVCLMIVVFCFSSYAILKDHHERMAFDINKVSGKPCLDPGSVLRGALSKRNWNDLQLSENFRKKYKDKYAIIPNIDDYGSLMSGHDDFDGKYVLTIDADSKGSFFDLYGEKMVTTVFYFDYKTTEDNLLDDVTLLGSRKFDGVIGNPID